VGRRLPDDRTVSVAVELEALWDRIDEYGPHPHLITAGGDGRPHVVSVSVRVDGDRIVMTAGNTSRANVAASAVATLLWPAREGEDYSLIVDGEGEALTEAIAVAPTRAVLHRVASAGDEMPSCVQIVEPSGHDLTAGR
jgi:hypothetical protein